MKKKHFLFSKRKFDALAGSLEGRAVQAACNFSDEYLMKSVFTLDNLIQVYNKYFRQ